MAWAVSLPFAAAAAHAPQLRDWLAAQDWPLVILDEAQNTTREQMFMALTRLGEGSRCVITGDASQIDLKDEGISGLLEAEKALNEGLGAGRALIPHESGSELTSLKLAYAERISFAAQLSSGGDTGRALRVLKELLEYYPGDEVIQSNLASIHLQLEDWESARQILTEVSESGSSQFGVWLNLATAEAGLGNLPEARRAIDRAVALAPGQARGHLTRAEICTKQRDLVAARESALKAVELEPEDAQAFLILAEANTRLGQPAEACAAFERVSALNPRFLPSRVSAASLYLSAGRFADAERLIMEAEAIAPGHERVVQVRSRLEQLRRGAGR